MKTTDRMKQAVKGTASAIAKEVSGGGFIVGRPSPYTEGLQFQARRGRIALAHTAQAARDSICSGKRPAGDVRSAGRRRHLTWR
jgi:hypothetical protein